MTTLSFLCFHSTYKPHVFDGRSFAFINQHNAPLVSTSMHCHSAGSEQRSSIVYDVSEVDIVRCVVKSEGRKVSRTASVWQEEACRR